MLKPNNDQTRSKDKPVDVKQMGRYLEVLHLGRAEKINIQTTINTSSFSQPDYRISNLSAIMISNEQTGNDPKGNLLRALACWRESAVEPDDA